MRATLGDAGEASVRLSVFTSYSVFSEKLVSLPFGGARREISFRAQERDG